MTSTEIAITRLFDQLSNDLTALRPNHRGDVVYPLCLRAFGREAIGDKSPNGLSIEHVIPSSVGGRLETLTCRACNNQDGSSLDAHFVSMVRILDWAKGDGSELKGTVTADGVALPMRLSRDENGCSTIRILGGKPEAIEKFRATMAQLGDGDRMQLDFSLDYAELPARKALVRIAYLGMFIMVDYRFVFSDGGVFTRNVLRSNDIETIRELTPHLSNVEVTNVDSHFVMTPIGNGAYVNLVRTHTLQHGNYAVILPSPRIPADRIVPFISEIAKALHGRQCRIVGIAEK